MLTTKKLASIFRGLYNEGAGEDNWEPGPNPKDAVMKHEKNSDHLYAYAENEDCSWITTDPYDLTNVSIIEIEWEGETDDGEYRGIAIDPNPDYNTLFGAEKNVNVFESGVFSRQKMQMDVSGDSGDYYIGVHITADRGLWSEYLLYRVERDP